MEYEYTLTVDADILIAQSKGIISSIAVLVEFNQRAFKEARKRGIRKILRDHRKTRWTLDFHDVVLFSDIMMAIPEHSQRSKNVTVFSQSDCFVGRMFETAAINRSLNYRPFVDYEKAVNWLNKGAPSGNAYARLFPVGIAKEQCVFANKFSGHFNIKLSESNICEGLQLRHLKENHG